MAHTDRPTDIDQCLRRNLVIQFGHHRERDSAREADKGCLVHCLSGPA